MNFFARTGWIKFLLVILLLLLGAGSLVYNQYLVQKILEQERQSVELWAKAIEFTTLPTQQQASMTLFNAAAALDSIPGVPDSLISDLIEVESMRTSQDFVTDQLIVDERRQFLIPAVIVDSNDVPLEYRYQIMDGDSVTEVIDYGFKNVDPDEIDSGEERQRLVNRLKEANPPIRILVGDDTRRIPQYVYYGESRTVRLLRFVPYIQFLILALLLGIGYTTYRSITRAEQSNLWVGMAKEAAHQLGTPISSLYGWIHLFRDEYGEDQEAGKIINEIENDVQRLKGVAERFGKIGSAPELVPSDIEVSLAEVVNYMERRLPRLGNAVQVEKKLEATGKVMLNPELFEWAVENLVKNALDAMQGNENSSKIAVRSVVDGHLIRIDIEDSGAGIESRFHKQIFKPGYSTKKRGWGLGLSLTRRIIQDYHNGEVFVLRSEPGSGTTMRIIMPLAGEGQSSV